MTKRLQKLMEFWFQASWLTKIFIFLLALMLVFRMVTSCIQIGLIDFQMGCDEPAHYTDEGE